MGLGIFWIICIIISTVIGSRKGAPWASFFLGVLFGPLGIILVIVLKGDRQCPFCKKDIDKDALKCPHCQSDLPIPTTPPEQQVGGPSLNLDGENKKCPICAEIIKLEAIKCRFCGHDFDPALVAAGVAARQKEWEAVIAGGESQEGMTGEAFCIGCRTIGPRAQMIYFKNSNTFYHKGCIPK